MTIANWSLFITTRLYAHASCHVIK